MKYTDVVLTATEPRIVKSDGQKRLTFNLFVPGVFNDSIPRELDVVALRDLTNKAGGVDADWADTLRLGEALAAALFPTKVWNALNNKITQAQASQEGVRIRLILSGSELNRWPWEFLVFNRAGGESKASDFLALMPNVSLVRQTATPLPAWRVEARAPAKVLVGTASPEGWPKLQVTEEGDVIAQALKGVAQLTVETVKHLQQGGLPHRLKPAHLFHFAGHGKLELTQSSVPGSYEGKASVVLEDEHRNADLLDAELLAVQLRDAGVRVAVLGACQTAQRDDVGVWSSVAEALLKAELAAVVGMQFPVRDKTALTFAQRFYGALAVGLTIDEAVTAGRVAVSGLGDARGWATPVLYLRSPDGFIFPEFKESPGVASACEQTRDDVAFMNTGLRQLLELIKKPAVADMVSRSKEVFDGTYRQTVKLKIFKTIHDALHNIESGCLRVIEDERVRNPLRPVKLKFATEVRHIQEAFEGAYVNDGLRGEMEEQLKLVTDAFQGAVNAPGDADSYQRLVHELNLLLSGFLSRLNDRITYAAAELNLGRLVELMKAVQRESAAGSPSHDPRLEAFLQGIDALQRLHDELKRRVEEHTQLQCLDSELRAACIGGQQPGRLAVGWRRVKKARSNLRPPFFPELEQATADLDALESTVEVALAKGDEQAGLDSMRAYFQAVSWVFGAADGSLKNFCIRLSEVSLPLKAVLEVC